MIPQNVDIQRLLSDINEYLSTITKKRISSFLFINRASSGSSPHLVDEGVTIHWFINQGDDKRKYGTITVKNFHTSRGEENKTFSFFKYIDKVDLKGKSNQWEELCILESSYFKSKKLAQFLSNTTSEIKGIKLIKKQGTQMLICTYTNIVTNKTVEQTIITHDNRVGSSKKWKTGSRISGGVALVLDAVSDSSVYVYCEGIATAITLWLAHKRKVNVVSCASQSSLLANVLAPRRNGEATKLVAMDIDICTSVKTGNWSSPTIDCVRNIYKLEPTTLFLEMAGKPIGEDGGFKKGYDYNDYLMSHGALPPVLNRMNAADYIKQLTTLLPAYLPTLQVLVEQDPIEKLVEEWISRYGYKWSATIDDDYVQEKRKTVYRALTEWAETTMYGVGQCSTMWYSNKTKALYKITDCKASAHFAEKIFHTTKETKSGLVINPYPTISLFDFIIQHIERKRGGLIFAPSPLQIPDYIEGNGLSEADYINTYNEESRPRVDPLVSLEHSKIIRDLLINLCNTKQELAFLTIWMRNLVHGLANKNYKRNQTVPVFTSCIHGGVGKSTVRQVLSFILDGNDKGVVTLNSLDGFNDELDNKFIGGLEETKRSKVSMDAFKNIITNPVFSLHKKFQDKCYKPSVINFIVSTNDKQCLRIEDNNSRRFLVIDIKAERKSRLEQLSRSIQIRLEDPKARKVLLQSFVNYLLKLDVSQTESAWARFGGIDNASIVSQKLYSSPDASVYYSIEYFLRKQKELGGDIQAVTASTINYLTEITCHQKLKTRASGQMLKLANLQLTDRKYTVEEVSFGFGTDVAGTTLVQPPRQRCITLAGEDVQLTRQSVLHIDKLLPQERSFYEGEWHSGRPYDLEIFSCDNEQQCARLAETTQTYYDPEEYEKTPMEECVKFGYLEQIRSAGILQVALAEAGLVNTGDNS